MCLQDCCSMRFITLSNYHFSNWLRMQCLFVYCHYFNLQFPITLKQFLITFTSLIILISHISQLLRTRKFYCFCPSPHICFRYAWNNYLPCPMIGEVLPKRSLIKHTCSWREKLIVLWTLNRQTKIFLHITFSYAFTSNDLGSISLLNLFSDRISASNRLLS